MEEQRTTRDRAVYIISVAAELAGVHPQTLRIYERKGLVRPSRTSGNTRRYSDHDIARLRTIQEMTQAGVNLAGVKRILKMQAEIDALRRELAETEAAVEGLRRRLREERRRSSELVLYESTTILPWER
ncbi:MAG TPA: helix-turn-helix transcriptional regulator [Actinomycetota bacterium]|nr:helix-turn-helix transcriptional regulator [Actinomycetota bacterium]